MTRRKVIYLTGAPAAGKTTLAKNINQDRNDVVFFSYGEILTNILEASGIVRSQAELRERSATIISSELVQRVDNELIDLVSIAREKSHVIVDSHAVTIEEYGFRAIPFRESLFRSLDFDAIVSIYAESEDLANRISENPDGRPLPTLLQISRHVDLQNSMAAAYACTAGIPVYFVENSAPNFPAQDFVEHLLLK